MSSSSNSLSSNSSSSTFLIVPPQAVWMDFVAGWCSGAMAVICCQPVDTLLTKYQVTAPIIPATTTTAIASSSSSFPNTQNYLLRSVRSSSSLSSSSSPWILARQVYQSSQPRILWRGTACMASAVPFQNALLLTGYGWGKQATWSSSDASHRLENNNNNNNYNNNYNKKMTAIFIGGLGGGMLQSFVTSPVEWIKVQQQLSGMTRIVAAVRSNPRLATTTTATAAMSTSSTPTTTTATTTALLRQLAGHPWRGLHATLWRDGIPHGVWFCSYEICKDVMETASTGNEGSGTSGAFGKVTTSLVSGAVAATVAWAVGYPFDLIKTRIQAANSVHPLGIWATARQIMNESRMSSSLSTTTTHYGSFPNVLALYRGFGWKLVRAIPASMIGFTTYEFVLAQLQTSFATTSTRDYC